MTNRAIVCALLFGGSLCINGYAADEFSTTAVKAAELEGVYTAAVERRAADILDALDLSDADKAAEVRSVIVNYYRALRARDSVVDAYAKTQEDAAKSAREKLTGTLHDVYVNTLSSLLTPEQVEIIKDKMTYDKVRVTFSAYCEIIPKLTEDEKGMIIDVLKKAREEAIDGGSAAEKHEIFDRYKEQINAQLKADGHDVDKAFEDYEAKQALASTKEAASASSN